MGRTFLLDTNAAIALLAGEPTIEALLDAADEVMVPGIVLGELYAGAEKSARVQENLKRVDEFASRRVVLGVDTETARWYGRITQQLRSKGRPIPQNDKWIAAIARQHGLTLLTRDEHFKQVADLQVETW